MITEASIGEGNANEGWKKPTFLLEILDGSLPKTVTATPELLKHWRILHNLPTQ